MPKNITRLESINLPSPCEADWDSMQGNDQVRFCSHCSLSVHNLSAMTRKQAMRLVAESEGRLCVRYYRKPSGEILNAVPYRLHQIKRRASRLAAGAFTAALSLSASVSAQTPSSSSSPDTNAPSVSASADDETEADEKPAPPPKHQWPGTPPALGGTITDASAAVIPNANVTLINQETEQELKTTTDAEGVYSFTYLPPGKYSLKFETEYFTPYQVKDIPVSGDGQLVPIEINATLQVAMSGAGMVAILRPHVALVAAAADDKLDFVKQLISAGADVNEMDEDTRTTALAQAVMHGNLEMVRELLDAGAKVSVKNSAKPTILMYLRENTSAELVRALVSAGAKVNRKDEDGETPLMMVADLNEDRPEVLQALIDAGAKVNARNDDGETALSKAARNINTESVRVLLMAGADPNIKNEEGESPLQHARKYDNEEIIQLLLSYNAIE
jgi:hypothetical protein